MGGGEGGGEHPCKRNAFGLFLSLSSQEKEDFSIASVPMKCNDEKNDNR